MPTQSSTEYVQILHGSQRLSGPLRQHLGFIQVAFPDSAGGYRRAPISLEAFIAERSTRGRAKEEHVVEEGNLVTLKEAPHASKR